MDELKKRHARWCKSLQRAVETDGWGQVIEAVEAYERLATQLVKEAPQFDELSNVQVRTLEKVAGSLELRAKCLSSVADGDLASPTKEDMEDILEVLCSVLSDAPKVFPADLGNVSRPTKRASTVQVVEMDDADNDADNLAAAAATLALDAVTNQPARAAAAPRRAGETYVSVQIAKIGLKDAPTYTNPTVVVSVFDRDGRAMGETVETLVGTHSSTEPQHVSFQSSLRIELEPSVQDMEARGVAIFFEFYHYKPKKRKKSCRCWTLLEMDEVAAVRTNSSSDSSATLALELYEKPMDPKRKRINLFTVKELYLHVHVALHTHTLTSDE